MVVVLVMWICYSSAAILGILCSAGWRHPHFSFRTYPELSEQSPGVYIRESHTSRMRRFDHHFFQTMTRGFCWDPVHWFVRLSASLYSVLPSTLLHSATLLLIRKVSQTATGSLETKNEIFAPQKLYPI
jgi:hypothetical protein